MASLLKQEKRNHLILHPHTFRQASVYSLLTSVINSNQEKWAVNPVMYLYCPIWDFSLPISLVQTFFFVRLHTVSTTTLPKHQPTTTCVLTVGFVSRRWKKEEEKKVLQTPHEGEKQEATLWTTNNVKVGTTFRQWHVWDALTLLNKRQRLSTSAAPGWLDFLVMAKCDEGSALHDSCPFSTGREMICTFK